jgi:hypothetical protein
VLTPEQIASLCRLHAPDIQFIPGQGPVSELDPVKLLWAFSGVESSFGANSVPKHETAYCYGGRWFDGPKTKLWGCWAHCSYGSWQVMFPAFPPGVTPAMLFAGNPQAGEELTIRAAVTRINTALRWSRSLGDLARGYNGRASSEQYLTDLATYYAGEMPQGATT